MGCDRRSCRAYFDKSCVRAGVEMMTNNRSEEIIFDGYNKDNIDKAAELIKRGEVVAFPTETVYGLGAICDNDDAVAKIFKIKERPNDNPLIVHVSSIEQAKEYVLEFTKIGQALADAFWPGPLTLVMKKDHRVSKLVSAGLDTVAIRFPEHPVAIELIKRCGGIAAPSANLSGRPSPTKAEHVEFDLGDKLQFILDGGECEKGLESTVVDVTGDIPVILRPGHVTAEQIKNTVGSVAVAPGVLENMKPDEKPLSPGMKHRHYAPDCEVLLFNGETSAVDSRIRIVYEEIEKNGGNAVVVSNVLINNIDCIVVKDTQELAKSFYAILLEAEKKYTHVLVKLLDEEGIGLAIKNRAIRSAGFKIENCI